MTEAEAKIVLGECMCDKCYSKKCDIKCEYAKAHDVAIKALDQVATLSLLIEKLGKYEDLEEQGRLIKLPVKDGATVHRECVHIKSTCYHENYKCSECPLTELFCDEFYKAIDRCYEEAYASGCLAGMDLAKAESEQKLKEMESEKQ